MYKVNSDGSFAPFDGITVISKWCAAEKAAALYEGLAAIPHLGRYFSLLPAESYHVTLTNLFTRAEKGVGFDTFIDTELNRFKMLDLDLKEKKIAPKPCFIKANTHGVINMVMDFSEDERASAEGFAKRHGVLERIPGLYHMTLAYQYKMIVSKEVRDLIHYAVVSLLDRLFRDQSVFTLAPAELCYFKDMTHFEPWDGQRNPFRATPVMLLEEEHVEWSELAQPSPGIFTSATPTPSPRGFFAHESDSHGRIPSPIKFVKEGTSKDYANP